MTAHPEDKLVHLVTTDYKGFQVCYFTYAAVTFVPSQGHAAGPVLLLHV